MGLLDKFLDAIKLNDDFDDDDEFFDDEDDFDDDFEDEKPKRRFFKKLNDDFDDDDDFDDEKSKSTSKESKNTRDTKKETKEPKDTKEPKYTYKQTAAASSAAKSANPKNSSKITQMRKKAGDAAMEVIVIRPTTMEDTREIADTLMDKCTVVLNLEGLDVYLAQRIIDFTCGACYSLSGNLQKISSYIYILTPSGVDISGDSQEILNGAFDIPSM